MKQISHIEIGATLFVPATHQALADIVCHQKYKDLKSVVIDTEDGINDESLELAYKAIVDLLFLYEKKDLLVFIRPKNIATLKKLLKTKHIEKIDGFVLPKFSLDNASGYLKLLSQTRYVFMPSIEGLELFSQKKLCMLKELLLPLKEQIPLLRYGLEDMLGQLKMKRSCMKGVFDYASTSYVLGQFLAVFKSEGFYVSGGVYPCYKDDKGFIKDVKRDLEEGLFGKTIIHPRQIKLTNELYRVTQEEYTEAKAVLKSKNMVFSQNDKMAEVKTMSAFSREIVQRKEIYGLVK